MNILRFPGCNNTRDLGGYRTAEGMRLREKRVIRSGELSRLSPKGIRKLYHTYGVRRIVDFRTDGEVSRHPIPAVTPIEYIRIPVLKNAMMGITRDDVSITEKVDGLLNAGFTARHFMEQTYRNIAADPYAAAGYRRLFDILLSADEGATLFFCSQGRDRTGIAAMLILSALDVPQPVIEADYMVVTRTEKKQLAQIRLLRALRRITQEQAAFARAFAASDISRLRSFYRWLEENQMTVQEYLQRVIGLSDEERRRLKAMYLSKPV